NFICGWYEQMTLKLIGLDGAVQVQLAVAPAGKSGLWKFRSSPTPTMLCFSSSPFTIVNFTVCPGFTDRFAISHVLSCVLILTASTSPAGAAAAGVGCAGTAALTLMVKVLFGVLLVVAFRSPTLSGAVQLISWNWPGLNVIGLIPRSALSNVIWPELELP